MKRTLIITMEYPPQVGGIATYVHGIAMQFPPESVIVYAPNVADPAFEESAPFLVYRDRQLYAWFWPHWMKMFFTVLKLIRTYGIEVVMVHQVLPAGIVAYLITFLYKVQYIVFFHGTDLQKSLVKKRKKRMTARILRRAQAIVCNSVFLQSQIVKEYPISADKLRVVYPALSSDFTVNEVSDTEIDLYKNTLSLHGRKVLLSVGRLVDGKGYTLLLRAIPDLLRIYPNLVWIIVGEGPKHDVIEQEIKAQGLYNVIRLVGNVPHDQLAIYYKLANVFALMTHKDKESDSEESFGYVFLEALAAGLPVVAGACGGVTEVITHGKTGLVVDAYDTTSVVSAIRTMFDDVAFRESCIEAGYDSVQNMFQWKKQVVQLEDLLR